MNWHVIPNWLVAGLAMGFVGFALASGWAPMAIGERIALAAVIFLLFMVTAPMLGIGGGVLKLIAVAFMWFGLEGGLSFVAISMLSCAAVGMLRSRVTGNREPMPYLPFAALAAVAIGAPWAQVTALV